MTPYRPILTLDDDPALRAALAARLDEDGAFRTTGAATVAEAEALLGAPDARFDALILDEALPDGDGCELCARLRGRGCAAPILMLTGRDGEQDVVRGLDAGASDYVAKPFRPAAKLLHDPAKDRRIRLTAKETELLRLLLRAGGQVVEREALLHELWGYRSGVITHTLSTHVYRLRQKIEPEPAAPRLLLTVGSGYRVEPAPARMPDGMAA